MRGWTTKTLADVCERITDGSHRTPPFTEEGYPFATVAHVNGDGKIDLTSCKRISPVDFEGLKQNDCRPLPGDVLFSKDGTVGKVALIDFDTDFVVLSSLAILRPKQAILNQRFLAYALRSKPALRQAINRKSGSAIRRIVLRDLRHVSIPIPPLVEQERIVKLLDEADELQKLRAQADRRTAALIPAIFHEMFGDNRKRAFERVMLEQTAEVVSGVAKGRKFNARQPIEVPYLRVANVQAGYLDLSEIKTIRALPEEVEELALRKGDVLLTEGGDFDKLGRGAMLEQDLPNCIHQNHVFRVRVAQSKLDPIFFAKFLLTAEAKEYFLGCAKRTTNLASINMRQLRALPVPVPPLPLQKQFAKRVTEIRKLEAEQTTSRSRLDALFQSLLHGAFEGEL